jgi:hypothetical protein
MAREFLLKTVIPLMAVTAYGVYTATPLSEEQQTKVQQVERSVFYRSCKWVRAAGKAPLYRGDPGYREGMDGDGDGVACEPYPGEY